MKLKKGDTVKVLLGKDRGKTGKIEKVLLKKNSVIVTGINVSKRHMKSKGEGKPGGIIDITKPTTVSKLGLICPKCQKLTRIGFLIDKSKQKHRVCKKCKQIIN